MASSIQIRISPYKAEMGQRWKTEKRKPLTWDHPNGFILLNPFTRTSQVTNAHSGVPPRWPAQTETEGAKNPATATEATSFSQEKNHVYIPASSAPSS